jgi:hypothetical protein
MQSNTAWLEWAESLRRHKLDGFIASLLEACAPLTTLGAQMIYLAQPFLGGKQTSAIAEMLEDEEGTSRFVQLLREGRLS